MLSSLFSALIFVAAAGTCRAAPLPLDGFNVNSTESRLTWSNAHGTSQVLERSTDASTFTPVAELPAGVIAYEDGGLAPGTYFYRLKVLGNEAEPRFSVVRPVEIGRTIFDQSGGFAAADALQVNGNAKLLQGALRLTGASGQTASAFTKMRLPITRFTAEFKFRVLSPAKSDGMTFAITADRPDAVGTGGSGLGFYGLNHAAAVKFDLYDNAGEGSNSTGLFFSGREPTTPGAGTGSVLTNLNGTGINLHSDAAKTVRLTYDGTTLTEEIVDLFADVTLTAQYKVNLAQRIGSDYGFVGFTGGTGGDYATQEIVSWSYNGQDF